ncbi:MAG TPA: hypothetical protein DDZ80_31070 [Cyanobacteria bacterium UBA8803]|nr:hypothetical protein [Cyanobacteria bacterium UBA8803]
MDVAAAVALEVLLQIQVPAVPAALVRGAAVRSPNPLPRQDRVPVIAVPALAVHQANLPLAQVLVPVPALPSEIAVPRLNQPPLLMPLLAVPVVDVLEAAP